MDMFNSVLIVGEGMGEWRHKKVWGGINVNGEK